MVDFMQLKYENPNLEQSQIANQLRYSTSTLQSYRNVINMLTSYRINPNNTNKRSKRVSDTNFDNNSHSAPDVKRPRLTSNDLKPTSKNSLLKYNLLKVKTNWMVVEILKLTNTI